MTAVSPTGRPEPADVYVPTTWARLTKALADATAPLREDFEWLVGECERLRQARKEADDHTLVLRGVINEADDQVKDLQAQVAAAHAVIRRYVTARNEVEDGLASFDLHNAAVARLEAAWLDLAAVLDAAAGPDDTEENQS